MSSASTMEVMRLVIEQERVITSVREAARLNGGTLEAPARQALESAASRIAELTAVISQPLELAPATPAPAPASGRRSPSEELLRSGRAIEVRTARGATVVTDQFSDGTSPSAAAKKAPAAAISAWASDDEDDEGFLGLEPASPPPTKKKKKKGKKAAAGRGGGGGGGSPAMRATPSPRMAAASPQSVVSQRSAKGGGKKASPRAGATARTSSPPRGASNASFRAAAAAAQASRRVASPPRSRAAAAPAAEKQYSEGLQRLNQQIMDISAISTISTAGGGAGSPTRAKPLNMKYIDRLHSLHGERERNLEAVRKMETASMQRLSSPPRSKRARAFYI